MAAATVFLLLARSLAHISLEQIDRIQRPRDFTGMRKVTKTRMGLRLREKPVHSLIALAATLDLFSASDSTHVAAKIVYKDFLPPCPSLTPEGHRLYDIYNTRPQLVGRMRT